MPSRAPSSGEEILELGPDYLGADSRVHSSARDRLLVATETLRAAPAATPSTQTTATTRQLGRTAISVPPVAKLNYCLSRAYSTTHSPGRSPPRPSARRSRSSSSESTDDELTLTLGAINLVQPSISTAGSTPHPRARKRQRATPPSEVFIPISCESGKPHSLGSHVNPVDLTDGTPTHRTSPTRPEPCTREIDNYYTPVLDPRLRSLICELGQIYRIPHHTHFP